MRGDNESKQVALSSAPHCLSTVCLCMNTDSEAVKVTAQQSVLELITTALGIK